MGYWRVDSLHVNVGNGDCSIHILVWFDTDRNTQQAFRCVLVDSGSARSALDPGTKIASWNHLANIIGWLTRTYVWEHGVAEFDSIVLTHWDEDHYGLLLWYIAETVRPNPEEAPNLLSFLKFKNGLPQEPTTVFYAPNWYSGTKLNGPSSMSYYIRKDNVAGQWIGSINVNYNIWRKTSSMEVEPKWVPFCIFQVEELDAWSVLGVEFFFGTRTGLATNSLEEMWQHNPVANHVAGLPANNPPGLYCVGALQRTAGEAPSSASEVSTPLKLPGGVDVVRENPTNTNRSSLAAVVYWSPDGKVSQYLAGDMDQDNEERLLTWLRKDGQHPRQINTVKISHHGSKSSTPLVNDLLQETSARNIILSIPSSRHIHPSWEIMWYVYLHILRMRAVGDNAPIHVLGTKYPHVFAAEGLQRQESHILINYLKAHRINLDAFDSNSPYAQGFGEYWDWVERTVSGINMTTSIRFRSLRNLLHHRYEGKTPGVLAVQTVVLYQLERIWKAIAHPSAISHPSVGAGAAPPYNGYISVSNQIDAIVIRVGDGETVSHKYRLQNDLVDFNPQSQALDGYITPRNMANQSVDGTDFFPHPVDDGQPLPSNGAAIIIQPAMYPDPDESDINEGPDIMQAEDTGITDATSFLSSHTVRKTALVLPPVPDVGEDSSYYLFASRVDKHHIHVSAYSILLEGSPLDCFVSALHFANLSLDAQLAAGTAVSTTKLSFSDDFGEYLRNSLGAQESMSVTSASEAVTCFSIGVVDAQGNTFLFTSDAAANAFGLTESPMTLGILPGAYIMMLGLETSVWSGDATTSLGALLTFAKLENFKNNPVITSILDGVSLTIAKNAKGRRNVVWFEPLDSYRTTTRLEADFSPTAEGTLQEYIGKLFDGVRIDSVSVIAKHITTWSPAQTSNPKTSSGATVVHSGSLTILANLHIPTPGGSNSVASFAAAIELDPGRTKLILTCRTPNNILANIFEVFAKILGFGHDQTNWGFEDWFGPKAGSSSLSAPVLRKISIVLDDTKGMPSITNLQIDLETRVNSGGNPAALFLITYTWDKGGPGSALTASLWSELEDQPSLYLLPGYERYSSLAPPVTLKPGEQWPQCLDLTHIGPFSGLPKEIPTEVTQAIIRLNAHGMYFEGIIRAGDPPGGNIPPISLGELQLSAGYSFGDSTNDYGALLMRAMIRPPPVNKVGGNSLWNGSPTQILGQVSYENSTWKLFAQVHSLYGSTLHDFFDKGSQSGIGTMLDNMEIVDLGIEYDYRSSPPGGVSNLVISGNILLGGVTLLLDFNYSKGDQWQFSAMLDTSQDPGPTTLGEVLGMMFGEATVQQDLPDFVTNIPITPPKNSQAAGFDMVSFSESEATDKALFFTAWLTYDKVSFWAIQYQQAPSSQDAERPPPRRVFVLAVSALDKTEDVPLIGELPQPFDEILLVYVQPQPTDTVNKGAITRSHMKAINAQLGAESRPPLPYRETRDTTSNPPKTNDSDVLLAPGAHFLLIRNNSQGQQTVVLDYVFQKSGSQSTHKQASTSDEGTEDTVVSVSSSDPSNSPGSAKAPYEKKIGPLTIRNIGFKYTSGKTPILSITLDASVMLGPIALDILGLSLNLTFTDKTNLLTSLPKPSVSLAGLAAAFDSPPIILAGMLQYIVTKAGEKCFEGGATISFSPWLFTADAYYGSKTPTGGKPYTTAFVSFALEGPIITLEFGEVNKIMGGFGYNTGVKRPDPTSVAYFPLLADPSSASSDPSLALNSLVSGPWFYPQPDAYWVAAGLGLTAFEMLQAQLVVVVEWNPQVTLGLYGIMTADLPAQGDKIAHIELGVVANVDFAAGTLQVNGQLAPSSFVLDSACHLTGGFAYYQWFGSGANAGDFVYTVGGYHRSFVPPAQYPNPPRLAISWAFDSALTITGEAYLAITPNVCMAGGRLDASLSLGPLSAWFDAFADMLINYKPFRFQAQGGVSVGVGFALDLWICTIHINVEIGATLYLEGPPFAGTVHVDFWVFGFDIHFGERDGNGTPAALQICQFYDQVLQTDITPGFSPVPHIFSCNNGLIPSGDNTKSDPNNPHTPWVVRGAVFQFTVSCKFAIDSATVTTEGLIGTSSRSPFAVLSNGQSVYARPMQLQAGSPLKSSLDIAIAKVSFPKEQESAWDVGVPVVSSVPNALWGLYCPADDPLSSSNPNRNNTQSLLNPSNTGGVSSMAATLTPLNTGVSLSSPLPVLSKDILVPITTSTFFNDDAGPIQHFPPQLSANSAWYPRPLDGSGADEWEKVRGQWRADPALGTKATQQAVDLWAGLSFTRWETSSSENAAPGDITGTAPEKLLKEEIFQAYYTEAPRIVV